MWKDIKGFDGYQVSDDGRVRTHNKVTHTERHGDRRWKDRELACKVGRSKRNRGDKRVDLWKDGKPYGFKVSRLVAFTFLDEDINDLSKTVNHKDGDFNNNRIENLELISLGDNIRHGFENGLYSTAVKVLVTDKKTGVCSEHRSMSMASKYVGRSVGYISNLFKKGIYEDIDYTYKRV